MIFILKMVLVLSKQLQILLFVIMLLTACGPRDVLPEALPSLTSTPSVPVISLRVPTDLLNCALPYRSDSVWNLPINWNLALIHPSNKQMMEAFLKAIHGLVRIQANSRLIYILLITALH